MVLIQLTLVEVMIVPIDWYHPLFRHSRSRSEAYGSQERICLSIVETGVSSADMVWSIFVLVATKE